MKDRIFSLETEYAISFQTLDKNKPPELKMIFDVLHGILTARCGIKGCVFLVNGSKFYLDGDHIEWSLPECRSPREVAVYDRAADHMLGTLIPEAENELAKQGYQGQLIIIKNNVDTEGNSYGCHENYMAERETDWLGMEDHLRLTARFLVPFLVTRQVFCGAGRVGFGPKLDQGFGFQISQRADFIHSVVSKQTEKERPIFNLAREDEPLAAGNYRRMHLVLGDSNMSGWSTWLKLGTTGILLRMIEDLWFDNIPHLQDPVDALHRVSRDLSFNEQLNLRDGQMLAALEIQSIYLNQARAYLQNFEQSSEEKEIIRVWAEALDQLEKDYKQLFCKSDWVTKKVLMDRFLEKTGLNWDDNLKDSDEYYNLLRMDIQYHDLNQTNGLYYKLLRERQDTMVSNEEIEHAGMTPPYNTRAKVRSDIIALGRRSELFPEIANWDQFNIESRTISLGNPMSFFSPVLYSFLIEDISKNNYDPGEVRKIDNQFNSETVFKKIIETFKKSSDKESEDLEQIRYKDLWQLLTNNEDEDEAEILELLSNKLLLKQEEDFELDLDLGAEPNDQEGDFELELDLEGDFELDLEPESNNRAQQEVHNFILNSGKIVQINSLLNKIGSLIVLMDHFLAQGHDDFQDIYQEKCIRILSERLKQVHAEPESCLKKILLNLTAKKELLQAMFSEIKESLNENDPEIIACAIDAFKKNRSEEHFMLFLNIFRNIQNQPVRLASLDALEAVGGEKVIDYLISLPPDEDIIIRWKIQDVLDRLLSTKKSQMTQQPVDIDKKEEPLVTLIN